jgi:hypothetical protein
MAYLLKARSVEPEKLPLLDNARVTRNNEVTARRGVICAVSAEAVKRERFFSYVQPPTCPRVEAGSNTSTVTLRVVGSDEMGSLKSETVKYGRESQGIRTRERLHWQGLVAYTEDRPVLSSERAPHKNETATVKQ